MSAFIDEKRGDFGVEPICRTLEVSASAYYQRRTGRKSARQLEDARLLAVIRRIHLENYDCYGYRRMWKALLRCGEQAARCTVQRVMREAGIRGAKRRRGWRTTIPAPGVVRQPDLVHREFVADAPDHLWVGDFTYLRTWQGRCYFAFIIDVYSRMIVGWQFSTNMRTDLVLDALRMALSLRAPGADFTLIHHTDHGSQYASGDYSQELADARVLASMGTVGDAYDNAMAESLVDSYKTELVKDRVWRTFAQLEMASLEWVDWYNHRRLHEALGDIPPIEAEQAYWASRTHVTADDRLALTAPTPSTDVTPLSFQAGQPGNNPHAPRKPDASAPVGEAGCAKTATTGGGQRPVHAGLSIG